MKPTLAALAPAGHHSISPTTTRSASEDWPVTCKLCGPFLGVPFRAERSEIDELTPAASTGFSVLPLPPSAVQRGRRGQLPVVE